jgi:hypothetical protein
MDNGDVDGGIPRVEPGAVRISVLDGLEEERFGTGFRGGGGSRFLGVVDAAARAFKVSFSRRCFSAASRIPWRGSFGFFHAGLEGSCFCGFGFGGGVEGGGFEVDGRLGVWVVLWRIGRV